MIAIVHISLSGQFAKTLTEFEAAVKRCPNVLVCYLMSGEYDYILRVAAQDLEDYERIHRDWLSSPAPCGQDQLELRPARGDRPSQCREANTAAMPTAISENACASFARPACR
jgi:DNA-binding Lrp family transcriptional regulator